jgi:hypothetical protein
MRKHGKGHVKKKPAHKMLVYSLALVLFAATLWYGNHSRSVLGVATGTEMDTGGVFIPPEEPLPTSQIGQATIAPTIPLQPTNVIIPTDVLLPTTAPTSPPIPTPVLVVPDEPVYVEIIDEPGDGLKTGGGLVDIGKDPV